MISKIQKLEKVYRELSNAFPSDYPAMVDFKNVINELNNAAYPSSPIFFDPNKCPVCSLNKLKSNFELNSTPDLIIAKVATVFDTTVKDIKGKARNKNLIEARLLLGYFFITECKFSYTNAGKYINRDHSTVIYYCKIAPMKLKTNIKFRQKKEIIYTFINSISNTENEQKKEITN